jgi:hypothetical protein
VHLTERVIDDGDPGASQRATVRIEHGPRPRRGAHQHELTRAPLRREHRLAQARRAARAHRCRRSRASAAATASASVLETGPFDVEVARGPDVRAGDRSAGRIAHDAADVEAARERELDLPPRRRT